MRTGIGYDIHRLVPTVELSAIPLGGVSIPCYFKVNAKSDGDVLLSALADACLGALALGDVGQIFGANPPRTGAELVKEAVRQLHAIGWRVANFDSVVTAEEPKLAPHADAIRQQIARLVGAELSAISVKAKAMDGLGPVGERKAIAAQAVVTLERI